MKETLWRREIRKARELISGSVEEGKVARSYIGVHLMKRQYVSMVGGKCNLLMNWQLAAYVSAWISVSDKNISCRIPTHGFRDVYVRDSIYYKHNESPDQINQIT